MGRDFSLVPNLMVVLAPLNRAAFASISPTIKAFTASAFLTCSAKMRAHHNTRERVCTRPCDIAVVANNKGSSGPSVAALSLIVS